MGWDSLVRVRELLPISFLSSAVAKFRVLFTVVAFARDGLDEVRCNLKEVEWALWDGGAWLVVLAIKKIGRAHV